MIEASTEQGVDIIIPVFNARQELMQCVESIRRNTDLTRHRVLLINDKSTDVQMTPYLDNLSSPEFTVLCNENNLGFSATVNYGMEYDETRDVILLNSDTIVTENWVEKLLACADSDLSIGTVTPLSNNAAICSVPDYCKDNVVPTGFTIDRYAALITACSMRYYPQIPVAVGYCMFIRRKTLQDVGLFDAATFGKGYGEENDFCFRASQLGYRHVLCDDTYIYHSGSMSFTEIQKQSLAAENGRILYRRYPLQMRDLQLFCEQNPLEVIQQNIALHTALQNGKKTILYVSHRSFHADAVDNLGGTQLHVRDLTDAMHITYNIVELARDAGFLRVSIYTAAQSFALRFPVEDSTPYPVYRSRAMAAIMRRILIGLSVDIVHVQHIAGLSLDVFYEAAALQIPVFFTFHDFYMVCPETRLVNAQKESCIGRETESMCAACRKSHGFVYQTQELIRRWRTENEKALQLCQTMFVPSNYVNETVKNFFPTLADKLIVLPHGTPKQSAVACKKAQSRLHVAFVGALSEDKGSVLMREMIAAGNQTIEWFLIGQLGDPLLATLKGSNVHCIGPYAQENLPHVLQENQIDVVCILTLVPETYCYVLTEVLQCGIPVVATRQGALTERVEKMQCGWLVSARPSAKEVLQVLYTDVCDTQQYQTVTKHLATLHFKTTEEMAAEYAAWYEKAKTVQHVQQQESENKEMIRALLRADDTMMKKSTVQVLESVAFHSAHLQQMETEMRVIKNSLSYKLMHFANSTDLFCRRLVSKIKGKMKR
ncbi:MAG: glycosyltransferase [Ruthenibacterium sp.]